MPSKLDSRDKPMVRLAEKGPCPLCGAARLEPCHTKDGRALRGRVVHYARCRFKPMPLEKVRG